MVSPVLAISPDEEPLVVLDDEADLAALPAEPALSSAAQEYLRSQGITDAQTWAAFRLGQVDEALTQRLLPAATHRRLRGTGIWLPTCDPRQSDAITGLIRLTPAQNVHRFLTPPSGLAAPVDLASHERVVLCDNPLLALRLHQAGVVDVALVEDPAILSPLADWLASREVLLLSNREHGVEALRSVLGEQGAGLRGLTLSTQLGDIPDDVRGLLGLAPVARTAAPGTPLSLHTVRDLYEYARRQIETAPGMAALRTLGLDQPDLYTAYRPGYLPVHYQHLLPDDQRPHVAAAPWAGNAIVLPAFDAGGVVVDLLACRAASAHVAWSLWPQPQGLLAPVLASACEHLVVTDTPRRLGRLSLGAAPALLLRGVADAKANALRLASGGVRSIDVRAHRDGDALGAALAAAGIRVSVECNPYAPGVVPLVGQDVAVGDATVAQEAVVPHAPAPPSPTALPSLVLIEHDRQAERAVYRFGAGTYEVTVPLRPTSTLALIVTGPQRSQRASFDLGVEDARRRNGAMIALGTGLAGPEVQAALVALLPAVLSLIEPSPAAVAPLQPTTVPMRADERDDALALLTASDLVERMLAHLGHLGADPVDPATTIALLAAISRLAERPLWATLTATMPGERFPVLSALAQATPADQIIHVTRLTAEALNHHDPEALRHKLLLLGDAAEISERAATSLRLLHDRGVLATTTVERSTQHGGLKTRVVEVHGPIAVLAAATAPVQHGLDHHLISVPVDDAPEAQQRQRQAEFQPMANPATLASALRRREVAIRRLQNVQRLLIPRPVAIPALGTISLPPALARSRLHHDSLVGLIQASALLHQHQRPTVEGCVVATGADSDLAIRLLHHVAALQSAGLSRPAHRILTTLWAARLSTVTMSDLHRLLGWDRHVFRAALDELMRLDYVVAPRGVRGQFREYRLVATAPAMAPAPAASLTTVVPMPSDHEGPGIAHAG